jgi:hypothetical protein
MCLLVCCQRHAMVSIKWKFCLLQITNLQVLFQEVYVVCLIWGTLHSQITISMVRKKDVFLLEKTFCWMILIIVYLTDQNKRHQMIAMLL